MKKRKETWIDRRCCDWDTFLSSVLRAAEDLKFPLILVNWCEARRYWRRYSCTGYEALMVQRKRETDDAMYLGYKGVRLGKRKMKPRKFGD